MYDTLILDTQKFDERIFGCASELTPDERHKMAIDVLAKVARLPAAEQAVLAAYFTGDIRAINKAACLLPHGWNTPLRREMARAWANDQAFKRTQKEIAETYYLSEPTVTRRKQEAFSILSRHMNTALHVLEAQLLDLIQYANRFNASRGEDLAPTTCTNV